MTKCALPRRLVQRHLRQLLAKWTVSTARVPPYLPCQRSQYPVDNPVEQREPCTSPLPYVDEPFLLASSRVHTAEVTSTADPAHRLPSNTPSIVGTRELAQRACLAVRHFLFAGVSDSATAARVTGSDSKWEKDGATVLERAAQLQLMISLDTAWYSAGS